MFEFASAFDIHRIDLNKHLEYFDQSFDIYCIDYVHTVVEDADFWSDYTITIQIPKRLTAQKQTWKQKLKFLPLM